MPFAVDEDIGGTDVAHFQIDSLEVVGRRRPRIHQIPDLHFIELPSNDSSHLYLPIQAERVEVVVEL